LSRVSVYSGFVFLLLGILSPLAQLLIDYPKARFLYLDAEAKAEWVDHSIFLEEAGYMAVDRTLNDTIRGSDSECTDNGEPTGRSHPEPSDEYGVEVVIDGTVMKEPDEEFNPFWAFFPDQFPVELVIFDRDRVLRHYNWVCVVPRWDQQVAYSIEAVTEFHTESQLWDTFQAVPLHYQGARPAAYYFGEAKDGIGIRLVLQGSKTARNNSWWTPIYEVQNVDRGLGL
jgi:hypothetical protein